ncbi:TetR/AcrR family transcriptional regulator [Yinghuangia sp. YIM S09857]|uniref:TetR/AcrR family transcriptional regulator n=1 Tax=Yinghuangia sp. YIM S09857 TaxID=3436929 RepID=UPI003F53C0AF
MLDAVIECILDQGYYEASSNAIARHAGVTWGTIQHQFGSREALLLAVVQDRWRRLALHLGTVEVSGTTLEERLACVMEALDTHYGSPEHLVITQIMLDLGQSPATSASTKQAVLAHADELSLVWRPLFARALGEAACDESLVRFAFMSIRGYLSATTMAGIHVPQPPDRAVRALLLRGIAYAIHEQAARAGIQMGHPT